MFEFRCRRLDDERLLAHSEGDIKEMFSSNAVVKVLSEELISHTSMHFLNSREMGVVKLHWQILT